ncbi:hypothetical protein ACLB1R_31865 [Escherichia coli]
MEVVRDKNDNCVVAIKNLMRWASAPVLVAVAPAETLTDKEYDRS